MQSSLQPRDVIAQSKFNSFQKRSTIVYHNRAASGGGVRVCSKGAPEVVLQRSLYYLDSQGCQRSLDEPVEEVPECLKGSMRES